MPYKQDGKENNNVGMAEAVEILTESATNFCKAGDAEKMEIIQKKSFELRKSGDIKGAKEIQNLLKEDRKVTFEAKEETENMIGAEKLRQMMGIPEEHRTSDGDQSPVYGVAETQKLKVMWAGGLNWNPNNPVHSVWLISLAAGDYDRMMDFIKKTPKSQIKELVEKRETLLNIPAIFHVVKGATMMVQGQNRFDRSMTFSNQNKSPRHIDCLTKLIQLGANLNTRDFAGFTALHLCVTRYGNPTTFKMAKMLLDNGADPNAKNRLGETALVQPIMCKQLQFIRLLLDNGTDPNIKDNIGVSCINMCAGYDKELNKVFAEARQKKAKKMRDDAKNDKSGVLSCASCGNTSSRRCTGCYIARYCSKECQVTHWKAHKNVCAENKKRYVPVSLLDRSGMTVANIAWLEGGKASTIGENIRPSKSNFVIKIQVPREPMIELFRKNTNLPKDPLLVYDENKNIYGSIAAESPVYKPLCEKIQAEGLDGLKGYFYAIIDKGEQLKINIKDIQLPRDW